ncbi:unnamed protein product [[Actinomadura] parvosata subsp. kistnae]|uniref:hypothetical protein n=1 Tax=[Actinomadura] parvosata TaxID=1955412 RepID=UPI000D29383A|nr:unnamed protein product [Actinomadura parvosata subsp. kistnae]
MITIHVSADRGIIVTGTNRDQHNLLGSRRHGGLGLRWSDRIEHHGRHGAWYEPRSRNRRPRDHRARVTEIATALQAAGLPTTIDEHTSAPTRPSRHADRQPYWISRARAAEHLRQHHRDPRATLRRLDRLRERLRRIQRELTGQAHPRLVERDGHIVLNDEGAPLLRWQPATGDYRDRLLTEQARLSARIAYWDDIVAQAAADGVKIWRPADFTVGDFALYLGTWYEVLRVNAKSLTIPTGPLEVGRRLLRRSENVDRFGHPSHATRRLAYAEIQGRMSSAEAATRFPPEPAG